MELVWLTVSQSLRQPPPCSYENCLEVFNDDEESGSRFKIFSEMQGAILPSSDAGILVLGWNQRGLRKVNPSSRNNYDFCRQVFSFVSALTLTSPAEFMTSWVISK